MICNINSRNTIQTSSSSLSLNDLRGPLTQRSEETEKGLGKD